MKLRKYFISKILFLFIFKTSLIGGNLGTLLDNVLDSNPSIIEKKLQIIENSIAKDEITGNYYPKIDFNYNYGYEFNKNRTHDNTDFLYKSADERNYSFSINQNIFRGYKDLYEIESNENNLNIVKNETLAVENRVLKEVIQLYFELHKNQEQIYLLNQYINKIESYLLLAKDKKNIVGVKDEYFSILDILNRLNLEKLELEFDSQRKYEQLKEFSTFEEKIVFSNYGFKINKIFLENPEETQKKYNPILKARELNHLNSNNLVRISEASLYPSLDLELHYNKDNKNSLNYKENSSRSAYLKLSYNLFNGYKDENNLKKTKLNLLKTKNKLNETKNKLNRELKTAQFTLKKLDYELQLIKKKFLNEVKYYRFTLTKNKISNVSLLELVNKIKTSYDTASLYINKYTLKKINYLNLLDSLGILKQEAIKNKNLKIEAEKNFIKELLVEKR